MPLTNGVDISEGLSLSTWFIEEGVGQPLELGVAGVGKSELIALFAFSS